MIGSDTGGTDVGSKWQELEGLIRSLQCCRRTRDLAESFRTNPAAQENELLNVNEVASHVLDLLIRHLIYFRRALENKVFLW